MNAWNWPETWRNPAVCACCLSPSVSSAVSCRSLRERLESLGESDQQMCHQVNLSDSSRSHSWAHCPSLSVCGLVLQPLLLSLPTLLFLIISLLPAPSVCLLLSPTHFFLWSLCPNFLSFESFPFFFFFQSCSSDLMWLPLSLSFKGKVF